VPQPINRVPPGLLSLLDIKSLGVNPVQLADQMSPVIDLANLYIESISTTRSGVTATVNSTGAKSPATGFSFQPGAGEIFVLTKAAVAGSAQNPSATTYRIQACVYDNALGPVLEVGNPVEGNAGDWVAASINRPLILTPGQGFGLFVADVTLGTAITFQISAQVAILRF
jgi:hypothetical protein